MWRRNTNFMNRMSECYQHHSCRKTSSTNVTGVLVSCLSQSVENSSNTCLFSGGLSR